MADVNANIGVNIDTSDALAQLKNLQRQISQFHTSVAKSSESAGLAQRNLQKNFLNSINAIEGFSAELRTVRTTAESFSNSLEKNKLSMREYFRFAASQSRTFGKNFGAEFSTIEKTAIERVKTLQTQYIKLGRDANGAMQSIAIRPTMLNMKDLGTQTAIAGQKQAIFNQLIRQGSTNLLNFGKNTQWAGRQLMVGFTLPLATLGITAGRVFMDMEKAAIKFKKVYGDLFTAPEETQEAMESIIELGKAYTAYGVAVSDALSMAADAAAAGFAGADLQNQTAAALKLSVLGQLDLNKALETTISLQNAFRISSADLATEIDFLNAVENQTVISLDDMTTAVPKVAPVIESLGGDVRDLAFFMAAMKEGGINASEGANALKSGLASLINPTQRARDMLSGFGVNLRGIIDANEGDVTGVVVDFAKALDTLDPMNRAQAIEQLFGKFQFARLSTLFANVAKDGTQASRVLELAGSSVEELAALSEGELGVAAASSMNKFLAAVENIKLALAPIGETFLQIATPIIEFGTKMLEAFNNLPDGIKKAVTAVITIIGGIGPIALMTFGLINNGIANMIKFFATVRLGYLKITGQAQGVGAETQYMTQEQLEAASAAASLDQAHAGLTQRFTAEKVAVDALRASYEQAVAAGNRFALLNPGMMRAGSPAKFAKGGVVTVGGRGNKDTEPALLTPGEAVIPAEMVKKYQPLIEGMIAGNIPGYAKGVMLGMPKSSKSVSKGRDAGQEIYDAFLKSNYANVPPTEYGHQISPTSGHSFPIFGLGGVYQKGDKQVFVKPVLDEKAAIAEMRSNEISRMAHGLEAPEQRIVVIRDPMDVTRQRRFLALESDLDPKFINNQPMGLFNEEQYFRQLVASLVRVDKDLSGSNVFGNVVADAGPAGVFNRASGLRDYDQNLPSMEEQAMINLLGIKGGAKRAFAESTLGMMAGLTPEQYRQRMLGEIQQVLPKLKQTIASFKLTNPTEVGVYDDMIRRLEQGLGVDWGKFHSVHSAVKIPKPKVAKLPGYRNGVVSVPGPKGKGDVTPAMLSPGEAVIPVEMAKKYAPLIEAMIAGKIPGYAQGTVSVGGDSINVESRSQSTRDAIQKLINGSLGQIDDVIRTALATLANDTRVTVVKFKEEVRKASAEMGTAVGPEFDESRSATRSRSYNAKGAGISQSVAQQLTSERPDSAALELEKARAEADEIVRVLNEFGASARQIEQAIQIDRAHVVDVSNEQKKLKEAWSSDIWVAQSGAINNSIGNSLAQSEKNRKVYLEALEAIGVSEEQIASLMDKATKNISVTGEEFELQGAALREIAEKAKKGEIDAKEVSKNFVMYATAVGQGQKAGAAIIAGAPQELQAGVTRTVATLEQGMTRLANAMPEAAARALQNNSPSKKMEQVGKDGAQGLIQGAQSKVDEAQVAGEQIGQAIVDGARQQSGAPRRAATRGNVVADPKSGNLVDQGKLDELNIKRQEAMARVSGIAAKRISTLATGAMQAGFAITSLAGIATMFGGEIGRLAGIVMQLVGLFTGLAAATAQYMATQNAANMMNVFTTAGVGKFGKGLMGGAKGLEGFKNAIGTTGRALAQGFPRITAAIGGLVKIIGGGLAVAAGALGVSVGALAAAIAAIVAIIVGGVVAYKIARDNVTRLGEVANMSSEKIDKFAELFGVTARKSDFEGKFTGTTAKTAEAQDKVEMVLNMENFESEYKDVIRGVKDNTQEEAELALKSLTTQLSASGFEEDAVEAIVNAIAIKAGRKDLNLKFSSISFSSPEGLAAIDDIAKDTVTRLQTAFAGKNIWDNLGMGEFSKQLDFASANFTTAFESLQIGFREGEISAADFMSSMTSLNTSITSLDPSVAKELVDTLAKDLNIEKKVEGLDNFQDKLLLVNAATAGIEIPEKVVKALAKASKAGASKKDLQTAVKLRTELKGLIEEETKALEDAKDAEEQKAIMTAAVQDAKVSIEEQVTALQNEATAYQVLLEAGWDAASAIDAVSDATIASALAMAATADERQGIINDLSELMRLKRESDGRKEAASGGGGGGGASKSAMQEALESLGKQRTEIKNNIAAYSSLRQAGFSAAEAATAAGDATLAAALASTKVGSSEWQKLVNQIRLVRVEALKTSDGIQDAFSGLKDQADEYYDILERQVERKYADGLEAAEKQAKALNRAIEELNDVTEEYQEQIDDIQRNIEIQFDRPIDALNEESSDLSNDLAIMDRAANEITKRYDEQAQALERVNKINQRLIAQQKQQIGLASALVEGDIAAAAGAMQDIRATNADGAAVSQTEMLDAAKQSEIENLRSEGGLSRLEIEQRQFDISQEIYDLEEQREILLADIQAIEDEIYNIQEDQIEPLEDQLELNEDIVQAIEDQKEAELEVIEAQRKKWEDAQLALDLSKVKAGEFNNVIKMAKDLTGDVVANWEALADKTTTLTIRTVMEEIGGSPTDAPIVQESGGGGGGRNTPASTPGGDPVTDLPAAAAKVGEQIDPFAWLKDIDVSKMTDDFFGQPWLQSLGAIFIGTGQLLDELVGQPIRDLFGGIGAWIDEKFGQPIRDAMASIGEWWDTTVVIPVQTKIQEISDGFNTKFVEPVKNKINEIKTFFDTNFVQPIKNLWTGFTSWFNSDKTMEQKVTDVKKFWTDLFTVHIPNAWNTVVTNLGLGIKSAINEVIAAINRVGNIKMPGSVLGIPLPPGIAGAQFKLWDIAKLNKGGEVPGVGPNKDTVPAMLTPGEFVMNRAATQKFKPALQAINSGTFGEGMYDKKYKTQAPKFASRDFSKEVHNLRPPEYLPTDFSNKLITVPTRDYISTGDSGSVFAPQSTTATQLDNPVYNYNLSVNVNGSNANADEIANSVMGKIKKLDSQRIRKQMVG